MSIYTLKRKTLNGNPRLSPISGNNPLGFALNGTRRIKGIVGETNLGSHKIPNLGSHQNCCTSNSNEIIKKSVKNTKGMLSSRYTKLLHGAYPGNIVQPISNSHIQLNTQSQFIAKLHALNICVLPTNKQTEILPCTCNGKVAKNRKIYSKDGKGATSQSNYIQGQYLKANSYLLPPCELHFPGLVLNSGMSGGGC